MKIRGLFWLALAASAHAATFTVTTTNHTGAGSLRQAITDANTLPGADVIDFNLPGPTFTIMPSNALPLITEAVTIDGRTQPGIPTVPMVELNGQFAGSVDGLRISASNCVIRGLVINRFSGDGVEIVTNGFCRIEGNVIGLSVGGITNRPNGANGVFINGCRGNVIGGTNATQRNVISGNSLHGVQINGAGASNNVVIGNWIGLGGSGTNDLGNVNDGINISGARNNRVGGSAPGEGNVVSGNNNNGIEVNGVGANATIIQGNIIGADASGTLAVGNQSDGILFASSAFGNLVGGIAPSEGNLIVFSATADGVSVSQGTNNAVRANRIFGNSDLGIDLGSSSGVTTNDLNNTDTGPNDLQNFPVLLSAIIHTNRTTISGTLSSASNSTYAVDFFVSRACDNSGYGQGELFLGTTNVTTDASGNVSFTVTLPSTPTGRFITATATATNGNTSEFSQCLYADSSIASQTFTVVNTNNSGAGSLRQAIIDANNAITASDTIAFNIPGAGPHTIFPAPALPFITDMATIIDGYTQPGAISNLLFPGFDGVLKIKVDGASAGGGSDGLRIVASNCVVRGLTITRFAGDGIELATNGSHTRIEGNVIGLDFDGTAQGNGGQGLFVNGTPLNRIGGLNAEEHNVFSGNSGSGIRIEGAGARSNLIQGNLCGTALFPDAARPNGADGISVVNAPGNQIGGTDAGSINVIGGNLSDGIELTGGSSSNNTVEGNYIGIGPFFFDPIPNNGNGVLIGSSAGNNRIGGFPVTAANYIARNSGDGVYVQSGTNNLVTGNSIFDNGGLGIDLGSDGITPNDLGDGDSGANGLQNFPVITSATINSNSTAVSGTLNSRSNASFTIEVFANRTCDVTGNGEGSQRLGVVVVTTDANSNASFSATFPVEAEGRFITATAIDANGNTSEYSSCFKAQSTLAPRTYVVSNTNDFGGGSLRNALLLADTYPSGQPNIIAFNIPGPGPHTIFPLSQLPTNRDPVLIDGYTQPGSTTNSLPDGFNGVLKIRIDGGRIGGFGAVAMRLQSGGSTVRGLAFTGWGNRNGIEISGGGSNRIAGCLIGIDTDGSDKHASHGITVTDSPGNVVGGLSPADRNIISYNFSHGVYILGVGASNNVVQGNFIGTDITGTLRRGNAINGIQIDDGSFNLIGGTGSGARNVISGNSRGVRISAFTPGAARGTMIQGNRIGTDVSGTIAIGNTFEGISVVGPDTIVGGAAAGAGNVISGNGQFGIDLSSANGTVLGNRIGVGSTGGALSNVTAGVAISGSSNRVGGVPAGEGNIIANNRGWGVYVFSGTQNQIRGNSIHENNTQFPPVLGIDLGGDGITANDAGDGDSGPNNRQNFPVITSASSSGSSATIAGTLNSVASQTYQLDFFANLVCDGSGNGEGQFYLGSTSVNTDGSGNGSFNVVLPMPAPGRFVTATATDPLGNSSEFSACFEALLSVPPATFTVVNTNDAGPGSLRQAILDSNGHVSSSNNTIAFDIPGAGVRAIKLLSALPAFTQPVTIDGFTQPGSSANTLLTSNNANWLVELRGIGANFNEETLRLNIAGLVVRGLRISGSAGDAIEIVSSNCVVAGCCIYSNTAGGIKITSSHGNRIGGTAPSDHNVISGHGGSRAIEINNGNSNAILGNLIGPAPNGANTLGSQFDGVSIFAGSGNVIGDGTAGGGNTIAFSSSDAVSIQSGTNNSVRGNQIFSNGFGIDLGSDQVTANDVGDGDGGPNERQNFPVVTNAIANAGSTVVQGRLNSRPSTIFKIDFFASTACHFSGNGEGEFYLGNADVTTDASGNVDFNVTIPVTAPRTFVTATATDPFGNTSEFSACKEATINLPSTTNVVVNTNDSGPGSLRQAVLDAALTRNVGADRIHFSIPGNGPHSIRLLSDFPTLTEPLVFDGYTQPGASPNTLSNADNAVVLIEIDGTGVPSPNRLIGLTSNSTVRGISFRGNSGAIIFVSGNSNVIEGNWFGVRPSGQSGTSAAIAVDVGGDRNRIGGLTPAERNIIGNAATDGVRLFGDSNVVQGNFIGVGLQGTNPIANVNNGVRILGGAIWNTIGGLDPAAGNVIRHNQRYGVAVESGRQNGILSNRMMSNRLGGIFVAPGANDGVRPPQITQAYTGSIVVEGKFQGLPNTTYLVQTFGEFLSPFGVITDLIGNRQVTTDSNGNAGYRNEYDLDASILAPPFLGRGVFDVLTCDNNSSEESNPMVVVPGNSADLGVGVQGPTLVTVGSTNSYVLIVSNGGPATATGVYLEQGFPPGLEILSVSSTNGTCILSNGLLVCDLNSLAEGQTARVVVTTVARGQGLMVTGGRVTSAAPDANRQNNRATWDTLVRLNASPVDVQVTTVASAQRAQPGTNVNVVSQVRNNGPNPASGVVFRQALPRGTTVVNATSTKGTCTLVDGALVCDIGSLAANEQVTVTVGLTMGTFGPQGVFEFGSTVTTTSGDVNPANNVSRAGVGLQLPNVRASRENGETKVSWPAPSPGVQLETAEELDPFLSIAAWLGIPLDLVSLEAGNQVYRPETSNNEQAFYRLRPTDPPVPTVQLYQQSLFLDSVWVPFSDWGRVDVTFVPQEGVVQYFNLSQPCPENGAKGGGQTNDCPVIENMPLVTNAPTNRPVTVSLNFKLSTNGYPITNVTMGWSLGTNLMTFSPQTTNMYVSPFTTRLGTGVRGSPTTWWPATGLTGGTATNVYKAKAFFPNMEQGLNEDVPAAVMNSMLYLKTYLGVTNLPRPFINLTNMMVATGWEPGGAPEGTLGFGTWVDMKKDFMKSLNIQIQTIETNSIQGAIWALTNCYDVEIWMEGHTACVWRLQTLARGTTRSRFSTTLTRE